MSHANYRNTSAPAESTRGYALSRSATTRSTNRIPKDLTKPSSATREKFDVEDHHKGNSGRELFPGFRDDSGYHSHSTRGREPVPHSKSSHASDRGTSGDCKSAYPRDRGSSVTDRSEARYGRADESQTTIRNRVNDLRVEETGRSRSSSQNSLKRKSQYGNERPAKGFKTSRATIAANRYCHAIDPLIVNSQNCNLGTLIQSVVMEEAVDPRLIEAYERGEEGTGIFLHTGKYYIRKNRPFIVTAVYTEHYTCIPLHTNNGTGLSSRAGNSVLMREYAPIRVKQAAPGDDPTRVLIIEATWDDFEFEPNSYAWLSYNTSRRFSSYARVIGRLDHPSTVLLMGLLKCHHPSSQPIEENLWEPPDPEDRSLGMGAAY